MNKVPRPRRIVQSRSAADWPSSPKVDGFVWNLGPDPQDAAWLASQNADWHSTEPTPIDVLDADPRDLDQAAGEAQAQDQLERGYRLF